MILILKAALSALFSVIIMFLLAKLLGKRQVSQLDFFDYITGITIGSIAAELAITEGREMLRPLTAMIIYAAASYLIAFLSNKSVKARRFFVGHPIVLYSAGKLYEKNLMSARIDVNEFLTMLRAQGYFDLSDIEIAIYEVNGGLSVLPKCGCRPATPDDLKIIVPPDRAVANVIIDGNIMELNLKRTGNNEVWLRNELERQGAKLSELILATVDSDNRLTVYERMGGTTDKDSDMFI